MGIQFQRLRSKGETMVFIASIKGNGDRRLQPRTHHSYLGLGFYSSAALDCLIRLLLHYITTFYYKNNCNYMKCTILFEMYSTR